MSLKKFDIYFGILRLPVDFTLAYLALYSAYFLRQSQVVSGVLSPVDESYFAIFSQYLMVSFWYVVGLIVIFSFFGLYSLKSVDRVSRQFRKVFLSVLVWLMAIISYYFLIRSFPFSRSVIFLDAALVMVFVGIGRYLVQKVQNLFLKRGIGVRRVILVGDNKDLMVKIYESLKPDIRYRVVGYLSSKKLEAEVIPYKLYIGGIDEAESAFKRRKFDDVLEIGRDSDSSDLISLARVYHKGYQYLPEVFELNRNVTVGEVSGLPIFIVNSTRLDGWRRVLKRVFDLVVSFILLVVLIPVFVVVALVIVVESRGGVFFRRDDEGNIVKRVGVKGREFHCWKFRTMKAKTHGMRSSELAGSNIRGDSPLIKIKNDPRVTRVGRFLRRFDIDELPQLWNVFIGQMSLVGPRPHLIEEVEKYKKEHRFVFTVKPGITGLAQVSGRSDLDFEDEVRLDSFYIENWSLWLDIKILFRTIGVVFGRHGEM